jgi:hypothetical protein
VPICAPHVARAQLTACVSRVAADALTMGRLRAEPVRHRLGYVAEAVELGAEEVEVEASRTLCGTLDWLELYEEIAALKEVPSTLSLFPLSFALVLLLDHHRHCPTPVFPLPPTLVSPLGNIRTANTPPPLPRPPHLDPLYVATRVDACSNQHHLRLLCAIRLQIEHSLWCCSRW